MLLAACSAPASTPVTMEPPPQPLRVPIDAREPARRVLADAQTGAIEGTVFDAPTHAAAEATVLATSPALQGERVVIAGSDGSYFAGDLTPGTYIVTVYYDNSTVQVPDIDVVGGYATHVDVVVKP